MIRNSLVGVVATACLAVGLSAAPAAAAPACDGVAAQDRNVKTCTTTTTEMVLGAISSASYQYKAQDAQPSLHQEVYRTLTARSQPETVIETVTVTTTIGGGSAGTTSSTRVISSEQRPVSCFAQERALSGQPLVARPTSLQECARYGLFTGVAQPVQMPSADEACLAALAEVKGRSSCTTTSQWLGDVIGATSDISEFGGDPYAVRWFTGTSRRVTTVQTTYSTFKGDISSTVQILNTEVQPLNCTLDITARASHVQSGVVAGMAACAELGLFRAT